MLVLTRKMGERIVIRDPEGNALGFIEPVRGTGRSVRIGVDLPREYSIYREEVDKLRQQELEAKYDVVYRTM